MLQKSYFKLLGLSGMCLLSANCTSKSKDKMVELPTKPNVIIILADDIGYGDLSCNGELTIRTPNVDNIASQGVRFTDAHAVAATSTPSRYSLLTGNYSWRRNDTGIAAGNAGMIIQPKEYTIAQMFQQAGYKTAAVGKWHLGLGKETAKQDWNGEINYGPREIGFDYSYIMAATGDRVPCVYVENQSIVNLDAINDPISVSYTTPFHGEPLGKDHPELLKVMKPSPNHGHDQAIVNGISRIGYMTGGEKALWLDENIADSITAHAVSFIKENKDQPFFLYFGTNDIHVPRVPHPRFVGKSGMGPRGDAILEFDWSVGQVMQAVKDISAEKNTIIIITSDNGPVVDDGYIDQAVELLGKHRPWGDFRGGKYSAFEAGTRIPLIIALPGYTQTKTSDALVSQIDFLSSFSGLTGVTIPEGAAKDSQNHIDALLGNSNKGRDYVIESASTLSVSNGEWKYIEPSKGAKYNKLTNTELGNDTLPQLYNLKNDKGEKENLYLKNPNKLKELKNILELEKSKF
ncbi:MAG: sulfatase family protein [Candidatus Saccharimonadaceae bacterium]